MTIVTRSGRGYVWRTSLTRERRVSVSLAIGLLVIAPQLVAADASAGGTEIIDLLRVATKTRNTPAQCESITGDESRLVCAYLRWKLRADPAMLLAYRYDGGLYTIGKIDDAVREYLRQGGPALLNDRAIGDEIIDALFGLAKGLEPAAVVDLFRLGPGEGDYGENLDEKYSILFQQYPSLMLRTWDRIKGKLSPDTLGTTGFGAQRERTIESYRRECKRLQPGMRRQCREIMRFLRSR